MLGAQYEIQSVSVIEFEGASLRHLEIEELVRVVNVRVCNYCHCYTKLNG